METERIIELLRGSFQAPKPERKETFLKEIEKQGILAKRPAIISHRDFLLSQFAYVGKWIWLLSAALLLFITGVCYRNQGNYPFALSPFLAAGILMETERSFRWKMAELEYTARFSLRSVMLARMFLVGTVETVGLMVVIWVVQPWFSYSLGRIFLYMMVPYLLATLSGSVYERRYRPGSGWGSVILCFLSSALFALAPHCISGFYEERLTLWWGVAFVLLILCLGSSMHRWLFEMEEPVWS